MVGGTTSWSERLRRLGVVVVLAAVATATLEAGAPAGPTVGFGRSAAAEPADDEPTDDEPAEGDSAEAPAGDEAPEGDGTGDAPEGPTPGGPSEGEPEELTNCEPITADPIPGTPWAQTRLQYERVHELATGRGVIVAVLDTGVQGRAHQLADVDHTGEPYPTGGTHVYEGENIVHDTGTAWDDCDGHGTFIAGIIAGRLRSDSDFVGLAPHAAIYPIRFSHGRVIDDTGEEDIQTGSEDDMARAIQAAINAGVDVINLSSVTTYDSPAVRTEVQRALDNDIVVVASAGNTASEGNPVTYPGAYEGVITVGAVDENGTAAEFSQSSVPISVVAPGVNVTGPATRGGLLQDNGTSFAAPFVAATAALLRQAHPTMSAAEIKRRIERTADHPGVNVPHEKYGWGIVNPYEALTAVLPAEDETSAAPEPEPGPGYVPPAPPDPRPRIIALTTAAVAIGAVIVMFLAIGTYRRGRLRRWRAGRTGPATLATDGGDPGLV